MEKFEVFTGVGAPLRRSNVDTDQIIPAVYLKRITKTGFEDALFASCLLYTSPSPRDYAASRMPSSA